MEHQRQFNFNDARNIHQQLMRTPPAETLRTTPALPGVLPTSITELQTLKNSLAKDIERINSQYERARRYHWEANYEQYVPVLRRAMRELEDVSSALTIEKKKSVAAKAESLAVRDAIPPSVETLLGTLNGTIVINPIFNDIAKEKGLDTKGYLKDDKIKTIVEFYKKKTDLLKDALRSRINKLDIHQLRSTLNMLSNEKNALISESVVKTLNNNKKKIKAILDIIDNEILLDASKRGTKTTDGKKRITLPPRAIDLIQTYVGTKKAGIKKKQKKRTTYKKKN